MSDKLKAFMVKLASDQESLNSFITDAARFMELTGLSDEDRETLLSGDTNRIYLALTGGVKAAQEAPANAAGAQPGQASVLPSVVPVVSAVQGQYAAGYGGYAVGTPAPQNYWQQYYYPYSYPYGYMATGCPQPSAEGCQVAEGAAASTPGAAQEQAKQPEAPETSHPKGRTSKSKKPK
jgi:hypothetical protein